MDSDALAALGHRQRRLLTELLEHKAGVSADELAPVLGISRSAVHQHLATLEGSGYVSRESRASRGGRPGHAWRLTERGIHLFPKQYARFSALLIRGMKETLGEEGLAEAMRGLGERLGEEHRHRLTAPAADERVAEVALLMRELGYQSRTAEDPGRELPLIDARNCIYHDLAREHREVCQLDLALIGRLLDADVEHLECMVRGGTACRFRIRPKDQ